MPYPQFSRCARRYALYTGVSRQTACTAVRTLRPGDLVIPVPAERAQLLLEAEVFDAVLCTQGAYTEYPLGITHVVPARAGIRLHLEHGKRAENLLCHLLPCHEPTPDGGEIHGLNGLRIRRRASHGIELHRLGHPTSLWLTGASRASFQYAEAALFQRVLDMGWHPCWQSTTWTLYEERWEADRQPLILEPTVQAAAGCPAASCAASASCTPWPSHRPSPATQHGCGHRGSSNWTTSPAPARGWKNSWPR